MSELVWFKAPRQTRSHDTMQRLLDAAEQLLNEGSYDDTSVQRVVTRARSSVGAFYARFVDKEALLQHLHQRWADGAVATADRALLPERWHGVSLAEVVRAMVSFVGKDYQRHPGLHREIVRRNHTDPLSRQRSQKIAIHVTRAIAKLLSERKAEIATDDVLLAADMVHRLVFSVFDQHVQFIDRPPGILALSFDDLVEQVVLSVLGYLSMKQPR